MPQKRFTHDSPHILNVKNTKILRIMLLNFCEAQGPNLLKTMQKGITIENTFTQFFKSLSWLDQLISVLPEYNPIRKVMSHRYYYF